MIKPQNLTPESVMRDIGPWLGRVPRTLSISTTSLSLALNLLLHLAKLYGARHTDSGSKTTQGCDDSSSHLADTEDPSVPFFYAK